MKRRRLLVLLIVVLAAVAALIVYAVTRPSGQGDHIRVSGNIEVTQVQLSFRLAGWVRERPVDEGYVVKPGDLVAALDPTELQADARQRQGAAEAAEFALAALVAGSRPEEIAAAKATVERAAAEVGFWQAEVARQSKLVETGAVSATQLDTSRMSLNVAKATESETQQRYELVRQGPRQEDIDQARGRTKEARQALAVAQTHLDYATLASPLPGVVLSKNVEPGEFVAAGTPIVTIGNLQDMWLRAYIGGTDLGKVKLGQAVKVYTDSFPQKAYAGKVTFISSEAEFTPKTVQTNKERVKLVYRIKITIDNPNMELKPGMPADADISLAPSSTGILPVSPTGVSPVSRIFSGFEHGPDARATHGRDAHAT